MTAETKTLPTGAVLTITTDIVMVESFEGVHEAFEWVMGHPVWTHEMPRFGDAARERVLAQYPDIPTKATAQDFRQVYADAVARYGDTIEIKRGDAKRNVDPITSLVEAREEATTHDR